MCEWVFNYIAKSYQEWWTWESSFRSNSRNGTPFFLSAQFSFFFLICPQSCNHHYNWSLHFHHLIKKPLYPLAVTTLSHQLPLHQYEAHSSLLDISEIIYYVAFCVWLLSFKIVFSRVSQVPACIGTPLLFIVIYHIHWVWEPHFRYLFTNWWTLGLSSPFRY